jgi:hypothetical protein
MSEADDLGDHLRAEAPPDQVDVIIRGGPDSVAKLLTHAHRTHRAFLLDDEPVWGISVFVALDETGPFSVDELLAGRLATYRMVYRATVGQITSAGFDLLPTFKRPHYTLVLRSADEVELARLLATMGSAKENPHYRRPPGSGTPQ